MLAAADYRTGGAPLRVKFSAAATDPDGREGEITYLWDFGDGAKAGGPSISHTYRSPGTYTATLTVTDPGGETASASLPLTVSGPTALASPAPDTSQGDAAGESAEKGAWMRAPNSQRIRRGLRLQVACQERCDVRAVLQYSAKRTVTSRRLRIRDDRRHTVEVCLSRKVRRDLRAAMRRASHVDDTRAGDSPARLPDAHRREARVPSDRAAAFELGGQTLPERGSGDAAKLGDRYEDDAGGGVELGRGDLDHRDIAITQFKDAAARAGGRVVYRLEQLDAVEGGDLTHDGCGTDCSVTNGSCSQRAGTEVRGR